MLKKTTFWFSIIGWLYGLGLLVMLRFVHTEFRPEWVNSDGELLLWWLIIGLLTGLAYYGIIFIEDRSNIRRRSYAFFIGMQIAGVLGIFLLALFSTIVFGYFIGNAGPVDILPEFLNSLKQPRILGPLLFILTWSALMTFIRQMMVKVGPRILKNLLLGKYHRPRSENRIFLFIDLKASTQLAEILGHETYSRLIQDCFYDLTDSIIKHEVEVYQYIGDEAVLTWTENKGLRNGNCIRAYYDFIQTLEQRRDHYLQKYGYVPFFKAGANTGTVTVAEIGIIKREIAYLSEVLHTAARIQSKCNELKKGLLVSNALKEKLKNNADLHFESAGAFPLRGKSQTTELFSARPAEFSPIAYPEPI